MLAIKICIWFTMPMTDWREQKLLLILTFKDPLHFSTNPYTRTHTHSLSYCVIIHNMRQATKVIRNSGDQLQKHAHKSSLQPHRSPVRIYVYTPLHSHTHTHARNLPDLQKPQKLYSVGQVVQLVSLDEGVCCSVVENVDFGIFGVLF